MTFDGADGHGAVPGAFDDAIALAQAVLRADAPAHFGHVVGRRGDLVGLLQPALGRQHQPVGDIVVERAVDLAIGNAALRTARRLLRRAGVGKFPVDLVETRAPARDAVFLRHPAFDIDEFQHVGHPAGFPYSSCAAPGCEAWNAPRMNMIERLGPQRQRKPGIMTALLPYPIRFRDGCAAQARISAPCVHKKVRIGTVWIDPQ